MQVDKNTVVSIDYTLTNNEGEVLDTSRDRGPLEYIHGTGNLIPGLEVALHGKTAGDTLKVSIPPEQAYGQPDPAMVQPIPRENFSGIDNIAVGMQFQARSPQGTRIVRVVALDDQNVTVDANHPLAGQTLNFDVAIVDVREATPDELSHGHVCHGGGEGGGCGGCGGHGH